MNVMFVGVGEAFDETLPNNSQILEWNGFRMLIDCGYAVPHSLWKLRPDPNAVDAIYISHRHADHYFGLPSYLTRLAEDGRKRAVEIVCAAGMQNVILEMIDYAYQGIVPKLGFDLQFHEVSWEKPFEFHDARLQFAPSSHPVLNYSIAVHHSGKKFAYSGDGNINEHTAALYKDCDLLVHEAYYFGTESKSHAQVSDVIRMAEESHVRKLALTHLQRDIRRARRAELETVIRLSAINVFIPEPGDCMEV